MGIMISSGLAGGFGMNGMFDGCSCGLVLMELSWDEVAEKRLAIKTVLNVALS